MRINSYTKFISKITENLSDNIDIQDIKDIIIELEDEYGLETFIIDVSKPPPSLLSAKRLLIQINGYFPKSSLLDKMEKFSKDLNDIVKRLESLYSKIEIDTYSIDDHDFDGDGGEIRLEGKFRVLVNIYLNI
jgi:hypothetical protein